MSGDECQTCGSDARWSWFNGKGALGRYCDEHAKEQLPPESDLDSYKDPITTEDNATLLGGTTMIIPGGGVKPLGKGLPVIRSREAFEEYRAGSE